MGLPLNAHGEGVDEILHLLAIGARILDPLLGTARDLATSFPFQDKGVPDFNDLLEPETSLYFCTAYLFWLSSNDNAKQFGEEYVIRAYNGGPGGWNRTATEPYWAKYRDARRRFG